MKQTLFIIAMFLLAPSSVFAATDLELRSSHTRFSTDTFIAGEEVRVYATIRNLGDVDTTGYVAFYHGSTLLGRSQVVTVVADGNDEEVWTDFTVPSDPFNLYFSIDSTDPQDENTSNNSYLTPLYTPIHDQDGDGVADDVDNCLSTANANQSDADGDGTGDACDDDDDNDNIDDDVEEELGTDPTDTDSDDDGVNDASDAYPTDPTKTTPETVVTSEPTASDSSVQGEPSVEVAVETTQVAQESDSETISVDTPLIERASGSVLNVSPRSSFVFIRRDWKTYEFEALTPEGSYQQLAWDFGDGTTSVQRTISHSFLKPGNYTVTLTVVDIDGNAVSDSQDISISLFHLANPLIQMTLAILLVLLVLSTVALRRAQMAGEALRTSPSTESKKKPSVRRRATKKTS